MNKDGTLDYTVEQLERTNEALAALRRECCPRESRDCVILAGSPPERIRRPQLKIEQLAAEVSATIRNRHGANPQRWHA